MICRPLKITLILSRALDVPKAAHGFRAAAVPITLQRNVLLIKKQLCYIQKSKKQRVVLCFQAPPITPSEIVIINLTINLLLCK